MDLREIVWEDVGWIHLPQDTGQWCNLFWTWYWTVGFYERQDIS